MKANEKIILTPIIACFGFKISKQIIGKTKGKKMKRGLKKREFP